MSDSEDEFNNDENYYTFLNIPKNASQDEVNSAYRYLSRQFHPDKHTNVDNKIQAEVLFNRTKKAYEVLSDPHKRAIYDSLGVKGLETEGWEIVHRTRTPGEIREEYERLAKEREQQRLQQRTNPKGNITVNINATDIFSSYKDEFDEEGTFPNIEVSGMSISQSIEAPITDSETMSLSGHLSSHNGIGNGGFVISGRRLINKGWFEMDLGAGQGPTVGIKGSRTLTPKIFCNGGATVNFRQNAAIPGLVGTLAVQLDKHTVGYLTYNAGLQSSMSTVLERNTEKYHLALTINIGIPHCYLSASYTRKFIEHELKLKLAAKVGTFGFLAEYGAEKKISKYSTILASVTVGVPTGVILKIKLVRSSQSYIFPIHLSEEIIPAAIFYATVTPLLAWFVLKKTIIEPMSKEQKEKEVEKMKETNQKRMAEKKKEAESAVELMSATFERIQIEEEKRKGLIIIKALYGNTSPEGLENGSINSLNNYEIDVTIPLQCLIKNSKLVLQDSTKSELPGFYDPCVGEDKFLRIDYIYRDEEFSITVPDNQSISLPSSSTSTT